MGRKRQNKIWAGSRKQMEEKKLKRKRRSLKGNKQ